MKKNHHPLVATAAALVLVFVVGGCPKADKKQPPPQRDAPPAAAKPAGPTDADHRKAEALALAVEIDGALGTYTKLERKTETPPRRLELHKSGALPMKLKVDDVAPDGKVAHTTEFYFRGGHVAYVRHEQGLFVFDGASLILWLDRTTQQMRKGVSPSDALRIADDLRNTAQKEVAAFR